MDLKNGVRPRVLGDLIHHVPHSAVAGVGNRLILRCIHAQVNVVATPNLGVKRSGIWVVVGGLGHTFGFCIRQEKAPSIQQLGPTLDGLLHCFIVSGHKASSIPEQC